MRRSACRQPLDRGGLNTLVCLGRLGFSSATQSAGRLENWGGMQRSLEPPGPPGGGRRVLKRGLFCQGRGVGRFLGGEFKRVFIKRGDK